MGATYVVDAARGIVTSRATGTFALEDVTALRAQMLADPTVRPEYHRLVDLRDVVTVTLPTAALEQIAAGSIFSTGARCAIVANSGLPFGVARVFATLSEFHEHTVSVFKDPDEATAWLVTGIRPTPRSDPRF